MPRPKFLSMPRPLVRCAARAALIGAQVGVVTVLLGLLARSLQVLFMLGWSLL